MVVGLKVCEVWIYAFKLVERSEELATSNAFVNVCQCMSSKEGLKGIEKQEKQEKQSENKLSIISFPFSKI
jgi:hypothetical protein